MPIIPSAIGATEVATDESWLAIVVNAVVSALSTVGVSPISANTGIFLSPFLNIIKPTDNAI